MQIRPEVVLVILGMALVTYITRAGGFWLMSRVTLSKRVVAWLRYVPGCLLVAILAPGLLKGGPLQWAAAFFTVVVAARTNSLLAALLVGVSLVWAGRNLLNLP